MKIDYAIVSSDSNPFYLDFWQVISKMWFLKFNIMPFLIYIDEKDTKIDSTYGIVEKWKPVKDVPIYLQCLWSRYWYPITKPDKVSIISDIDMLPLSRWYYQGQIENIPDDKHVHINPCIESYGSIPSCYHIARGDTYKKTFELPDSWEESVTAIHNSGLGSNPGGHLEGKTDWFADERYATNMMQKNSSDVVLIPRNEGQNGFRIDRPNWTYNPNVIHDDYYYDSHSIRPFSQYSEEIMKICNLSLYGRY